MIFPDIATAHPDKKSILMYVTSLFQVLPQQVSIESIQELETLPRQMITQEEQVKPFDQQHFSQQQQLEGLDDRRFGSFLMQPEVDLESYQTSLEEVLTWLLSAEDVLRSQGALSGDVEEVKKQFHTHEGFMMELTSHQGRVGNVLQAGSQLLAFGKLSDDEENEIQEQLNLLNSRWESLRLASMDRQNNLHRTLMDLQNQQLQQLNDWLSQTEKRTKKMDAELLGPDLEDIKHQVEEHKILQDDLEQEQVRVNSLTHMVVVVDENSGDKATAALEDQLQYLGDRWAAICRWTEDRWVLLQDILLKWQHFAEEQCLFDSWLMEKEAAVSNIHTTGFKDENEMLSSLRMLAILKGELEMKKKTMDKLYSLSQDLLSAVKNKAVSQKIETRLENFAQRWDNLVQMLESSSMQISQAVATTQTSLTQTTVMETVTMVTTREQILVKHAKDELPAPPPQKKRQILVEAEHRKRFDVDLTELHSWMTRSEAVLQSSEFAIYRKEGDLTDLTKKVKAIDRERPEKNRKLQEANRNAQALEEQMLNDGLNADNIKQASQHLNSRWTDFCQLLSERLSWLEYQNSIIAFYCQMQQLEQTVITAENWLKAQTTPATEADTAKLQLEKCKVRTFLDSLPPTLYKDTMSTILVWIQQSETKLAIPQVTVTECEIMEHRLRELKALQSSLHEHQTDMNYLRKTAEELSSKATADVKQKYWSEIELAQNRWKKLSNQLVGQCQNLEELLSKLKQFQNDIKTLKKWMAEVDVFLNEEWPALGDSKALEKQLEQCNALVNDIQTIQPSLNSVNDVGQKLVSKAEPHYSTKLKDDLKNLNEQWDHICKQSEDNEGPVKELLQRGNSLQLQIGDDKKREEIKRKQQLLQSKHNTLKDLRSQRRKKALEISHQWYQYKRQADDLLKCLDDIEKKIASLPDPKDEQKLKEIDGELEKKKEEMNAVHRQAESLSKDGAAKAVEPTLIQLNKRWREIESKFAPFRRLHYAQIQTVHEESTGLMTEGMKVESSYVPSAYLADIARLLQSVAEVELLLNSSSLNVKDCEDLAKQEHCLKSGDVTFPNEKKLTYVAFVKQNVLPILVHISKHVERLPPSHKEISVGWGKTSSEYSHSVSLQFIRMNLKMADPGGRYLAWDRKYVVAQCVQYGLQMNGRPKTVLCDDLEWHEVGMAGCTDAVVVVATTGGGREPRALPLVAPVTIPTTVGELEALYARLLPVMKCSPQTRRDREAQVGILVAIDQQPSRHIQSAEW
ncbi:hypothetical protein FKM82_008890 [Ascaphus truei]